MVMDGCDNLYRGRVRAEHIIAMLASDTMIKKMNGSKKTGIAKMQSVDVYDFQ